MADPLADFYEATYTSDERTALRGERWRALSARGKAQHVIALCREAGIAPRASLEVGCGDGALLCELRRRDFSSRLHGLEIAPRAVEIARDREEIDAVELYDGEHLPLADGAFALGILSHVLEHVEDPARLLSEVARVCEAVVVEVPLEANISARRPGKRGHAMEVGHLQCLSRRDVHAIVARAGLRIAGELEDALPREVHGFFAQTLPARGAANLKWAARAGLHAFAPGLARRLFTVHYACLCLPLDARSPALDARSPAMDARPPVR